MLQTPNNVPRLDPEKNSKRYFFSLRASENKIIPGLLCYELLTWSYSSKKKPLWTPGQVPRSSHFQHLFQQRGGAVSPPYKLCVDILCLLTNKPKGGFNFRTLTRF